MNRMVHFGMALLLACASFVQAQQQAGVVSGRVVLDGKTSSSVEVVLLSDGNERRTEIARTSTDAEGRFRLSVEAAGRYRVMPFAPAYVSSNAQSVAKVITVAPGEEIKDVDFALVPGGVITGHVLTAEGRPAIAERIAVTPVAQPDQTRPALNLPGAILETDDRGVYRIFGLPPGRYLVSAGTAGESVAADVNNRRFSYTRTFHPNVAEEVKATVVEVAAGGETANVDITMLPRAESFTASGRIVEARGSQPLAGVTFGYAATREDGRMSGAPVRDLQTNAKGEFVIPKLTPGRYVVFVSSNRDANVYSEMLPFEVTKGDVTGLELKSRAGLEPQWHGRGRGRQRCEHR
ncbi:MAG TPA: SpaA isopeptide-forming pilin-related protein [Pyrinomonadaceae bacterium]|nr:SpaA isopeptide-forming pilin-related protein [Pyrinomonadaceae bacterium]